MPEIETPITHDDPFDDYDPTQHGMFAGVQATALPKLLCYGFVSELGDVTETQTGYSMLPITLEGLHGSRTIRGNILFLPEWFHPSFKPNSVFSDDAVAADNDLRGPRFVYQKFCGPKGWVCGILGSAENWLAFLKLTPKLGDHPTREQVAVLLQHVYQEAHDPEFFYTMLQQREDTGERDARGRRVFKRLDRYEIGNIFWPTPENLARERKAIERSVKAHAKDPKKLLYVQGFEIAGS